MLDYVQNTLYFEFEFHIFRRKILPTNDFELTVPNLYHLFKHCHDSVDVRQSDTWPKADKSNAYFNDHQVPLDEWVYF